MTDNFLKEKHSGGLAGHFGHEKAFVQLSSLYYWPGMRVDVKKFVDRCKICQHAKGKRQNTSLYQPFPIPERPWDAISMDFFYWDYLEPRREVIPYLLWSIDFPIWNISYHARKQMMIHT